MKGYHTHIPPLLVEEPDGWFVEVAVLLDDGETAFVRAPIGDGRFWAMQNFEKIILPALAERGTAPVCLDLLR